MQLSPFPPIPSSQPAGAYPPPEPGGNPGSHPGNGGTAFAQLLPGPAPSGPQKAPSGKKPDTPTAAAQEATAAIYGSWLAAVAPQGVPTAAAPEQVPESAVAQGGAVAAGRKLAGAPGLSQGAGNNPAANGGQAAPSPGAPEPRALSLAASQPGPAAEAPPRATMAAGQGAPSTVIPSAPKAPAQSTGQGTPPMSFPAPNQGGPSQLPAPQSVQEAAAPGTTGDETRPEGAALIKAAKHPGTAGAGGTEKIAGPGPNAGQASASAPKAADKKILNIGDKQVTDPEDSVGIGVARVAPAMPNSAPTDRQPNAAMASLATSPVSASSNPAQGEAQVAVPHQGVAQNAVEAAMSAAETVNGGGRAAVNMQFSVGNADLSLRVELRNGEIHTTFRTDSADLRQDLQHEWQSANPGSGSGSLRLAEPIFTSSGTPGSMVAGENASQQRGGQGRPDSSQPFSSSPGTGAAATASPVEADMPARAPSLLSTSLHLQAFA